MLFVGYKVPHPLEYVMVIKASAALWVPDRPRTGRCLVTSGSAQLNAAHFTQRPGHLPQVQTNGTKTPIAAVGEAIRKLADETGTIRKKFQASSVQSSSSRAHL